MDNGNTYTTVGGLTRSDLGVANGTNSQGANGYVASLSTGFTLKAVQKAFGSAWFGNQHVDLIVSDQNSWDFQNWSPDECTYCAKSEPVYMREHPKATRTGDSNNRGDVIMGNPQATHSAEPQRLTRRASTDEDTVRPALRDAEPGRNDQAAARAVVTTKQFWNKLQPQQRYMNEKADVANAGFSAFNFNGAQVVVDQYGPSGQMFGLNTRNENLLFFTSTLKRYQFGSRAPLRQVA